MVFGPHPRDYAQEGEPKKVARLAFRRALSEKVAAGQVLVVDGLELAEAKTRRWPRSWRSCPLSGRRC